MKTYSLLLLGLLFFGTVKAQDDKPGAVHKEKKITPPVAAKNAFEKDFSGVSHVEWEKEGKGYEVNFTQGGKEMSAIYDNSGLMKEKEESISKSDLPAEVSEYMKKHYKGSVIRETAKITSNTGDIKYEVGIKNKDLYFNPKGEPVK